MLGAASETRENLRLPSVVPDPASGLPLDAEGATISPWFLAGPKLMADSRSNPAIWILGLILASLALVLGLDATGSPARPVEVALSEEEGPQDEFEARDGASGRGSADRVGSGSPATGTESGITRHASGAGPGARIVGRLLGVNGSPLVERAFTWVLRGESLPPESGSAETDAEGAFSLSCRGVTDKRRTLAVQIAADGGAGVTPRAGARVGVPVPDEMGAAAVGDVRLLAYALLASGRVEDDLGRPVPKAVVSAFDPQLRLERGTFRGPLQGMVRGSSGTVFLNSPGPEIHIGELPQGGTTRIVMTSSLEATEPQVFGGIRFMPSSESELRIIKQLSVESGETRFLQNGQDMRIPLDGVLARAVTDDDGGFQLYGPSRSDGVKLRADAEGHHRVEQDLQGIGAFVTLRMRRVCEVRAEIFVADELPRRVVRFRLEGDDWSVAPKETNYGPGSDGVHRFQLVFRDVPVGPARFMALIKHLEESAFVVDGLVVDPERPVGLEQLQPLDLRGALFRYRLRAVHPNRRPVDQLGSPFLLHVPTGKRERVVGLNWVDGHVEFFSARPELEATLLLPGHRRERIGVRAGESDVVYTPIHPVRVVLPGLREAAADTDRVRVSMILRGNTGLPQSIQGLDVRTGKSRSYSRWHMGRSGGAWLGETDEVQVPLVIDGAYDVIVRLQRKGVSGEESIDVGRVDIELQNLAAEQHVVEIDRTAIRAAVDRQRARVPTGR